MNDRIDELISQCIDQRWTVTGPLFDREKFAELIVRECADYLDVFNTAIIGEVGIGGTALKRHFGVE